jgi:hypothetical protein
MRLFTCMMFKTRDFPVRNSHPKNSEKTSFTKYLRPGIFSILSFISSHQRFLPSSSFHLNKLHLENTLTNMNANQPDPNPINPTNTTARSFLYAIPNTTVQIIEHRTQTTQTMPDGMVYDCVTTKYITIVIPAYQDAGPPPVQAGQRL